MATAVKICGITRPEDGLVAAREGAHAIGVVFHRSSARYVSALRAREIIEVLPPFVTAVGLFVDPTRKEVDAVLEQAPLQLLQFHGDEDAAFCASFGLPYLKAVRVGPGTDLLQYAACYHTARGLLLDALVQGAHGGTGRSFDWSLVPRDLPLAIVLAGGLTPENVGAAIRAVRPYAVDVSSGVEQQKGIKDAAKIAAFIRGARDADV